MAGLVGQHPTVALDEELGISTFEMQFGRRLAPATFFLIGVCASDRGGDLAGYEAEPRPRVWPSGYTLAVVEDGAPACGQNHAIIQSC